jgi:prophage regulatory protein
MTNQYLTVKDVSQHLNMAVSTVWRLSKKGDLPAPVRIGGSTRWRLSDIEALLSVKNVDNDAA